MSDITSEEADTIVMRFKALAAGNLAKVPDSAVK
jgi:hypothetical protein